MTTKLIVPSGGGGCGSGCNCLAASCQITLVHVDENQCEDDIFGIYIVKGDGSERFIRQIDLVSTPAGCCGWDWETGGDCPSTTIEVPITLQESDFDSCCKFTVVLRLEGYNCCNTWTRFKVNGPGGEVFSSYFTQDGIRASFDARDVCNPAP
ncbi:MAG: hypothetical protein ACOYMV_14115 [Verrucomicrobiia bacterium]